MAEFIATTDVSGGVVHDEHHSKRVLIGDVESVKQRLIPALERLDYRVLSEQPIQAKRSGTRKVVGKIFNSSIKLTIGLRPSTANSTLATFDYELLSSTSTMYKGGHDTIEREVDAIVALASQRPMSSVCEACGTNTGDSRFCRACGVPNTGSEPAELEVLRLNAEARAGHRAIITGVTLVFATLLLALPLILFGNPKGVKGGWAILILGEIASWLTLFYGMIVLHRALNPKKARQQLPRAKLRGYRRLSQPPFRHNRRGHRSRKERPSCYLTGETNGKPYRSIAVAILAQAGKPSFPTVRRPTLAFQLTAR